MRNKPYIFTHMYTSFTSKKMHSIVVNALHGLATTILFIPQNLSPSSNSRIFLMLLTLSLIFLRVALHIWSWFVLGWIGFQLFQMYSIELSSTSIWFSSTKLVFDLGVLNNVVFKKSIIMSFESIITFFGFFGELGSSTSLMVMLSGTNN